MTQIAIQIDPEIQGGTPVFVGHVSPLRHYSITWKPGIRSPRFVKIFHPFRRNFVSPLLSKPAKP